MEEGGGFEKLGGEARRKRPRPPGRGEAGDRGIDLLEAFAGGEEEVLLFFGDGDVVKDIGSADLKESLLLGSGRGRELEGVKGFGKKGDGFFPVFFRESRKTFFVLIFGLISPDKKRETKEKKANKAFHGEYRRLQVLEDKAEAKEARRGGARQVFVKRDKTQSRRQRRGRRAQSPRRRGLDLRREQD